MKKGKYLALTIVSFVLLIFCIIVLFGIHQISYNLSACSYFERFLLYICVAIIGVIPLISSFILSIITITGIKKDDSISKKATYYLLHTTIIILILIIILNIIKNGIIVTPNESCKFF